jgi:hypothetical protein
VVQFAQFLGRRLLVAGPDDVGLELDLRDRQAAAVILAQHAFGLVDIGAKPARRAKSRKNSMWQAASAATSISSGSTASSRDSGTRTTCGEEEPTKETPPSNEMVCAREYLPSPGNDRARRLPLGSGSRSARPE